MIIDYTKISGTLSPPILPKGDRYDLPPGTGQFRLASLLGLLTAAAFIAGIGKWLGLDVVMIVLLEVCAVFYWWRYAQIRVAPDAACQVDQSALRAEVRKWLREREQQTCKWVCQRV